MGNPVIVDAVRTPLGKRQRLARRRAPRRPARARAGRGARAAPASTRRSSSRSSAAASPRPASSPTTWSAAPGCTPASPSTPAAPRSTRSAAPASSPRTSSHDMIAAGRDRRRHRLRRRVDVADPARRQRPAGPRRPAPGRLGHRHAQPVRGGRPDRQQPRPHPRADLDAFGLASQQKARVAVDEGRFKREIAADRGAGARRGRQAHRRDPPRRHRPGPARHHARGAGRPQAGAARTACTRPARRRRSPTAPPPC